MVLLILVPGPHVVFWRHSFFWQFMKKDITAWCKECVNCQRGKVTRNNVASPHAIDIPTRRFSHVHVDIVGPLPVAEGGYTYVLTMIDRTTRWVEAVPLKEMAAAACTEAFVSTWVARFGVPLTLTSDRGTQFTSHLWSKLCDDLGINHVTTTAYHPQSNGMVERVHRQIKDALRARQAGGEWPSHLSWVLLGLRAAPKEISGLSSAEAVYGQQSRLPGEKLEDSEAPPAAFVRQLASSQPPTTSQPRTWAQVAATPPSAQLMASRFVYIRKGGAAVPLAPLYDGPFRVVKHGPKYFVVKIGDREESVSVDRLKAHLGSTEPALAVPPKRGRPKKS
jgi:cleavage and polyadenylation specificity factor subunit 1